MRKDTFKVWIKDPYRVQLLETYKRAIMELGNIHRISLMYVMIAMESDSIAELKMILKKHSNANLQ